MEMKGRQWLRRRWFQWPLHSCCRHQLPTWLQVWCHGCPQLCCHATNPLDPLCQHYAMKIYCLSHENIRVLHARYWTDCSGIRWESFVYPAIIWLVLVTEIARTCPTWTSASMPRSSMACWNLYKHTNQGSKICEGRTNAGQSRWTTQHGQISWGYAPWQAGWEKPPLHSA